MDRNKVIKGLECCGANSSCLGCPYINYLNNGCMDKLNVDAIALLKELSTFKDYFGSLYGQGLEVVNWHLNGTTEPFDNFYESAIEESEADDGQE